MGKEIRAFAVLLGVFLTAYLTPFDSGAIQGAIMEGFFLLQYYAREHVITCLIPAFFIAGGIANFVSKGAVVKYFGPQAKKWLSYSVSATSGMFLAVCSCTILPLFSSIYKRGAGIGPAIAFLYSGPAINVLAVVLTARILGFQLGIARMIGAIVFAVVIGLLMALIFRKDARETNGEFEKRWEETQSPRTAAQNIVYFLLMVLILLTATMKEPGNPDGLLMGLYTVRWGVVAAQIGLLIFLVLRWFERQEQKDWLECTWGFAKQIFPLLFAGVFVAGFLMGRPGSEAGLIPGHIVETLVGGNSLRANLVASVVGAFMYFATLTEVPILQGLIGSGMGNGPALSLLLAGPALSLPNMLVIRSVIGTKKTAVFVLLVVIMATISGLIYGTLVP